MDYSNISLDLGKKKQHTYTVCILCSLHTSLWFAYKKLACAPDFYIGSGDGPTLGRSPVYNV